MRKETWSLVTIIPQTGWNIEAITAHCESQNAWDLADHLQIISGGDIHKLQAIFFSTLDSHCTHTIAKARGEEAWGITATMEKLLCSRYMLMSSHPKCFEETYRDLSRPQNVIQSMRILNQTTDSFWRFCGDRSTDMNYYTKRGVLASVLGATTYAWMKGMRNDQEIAQEVSKNLGYALALGKIKKQTGKYFASLIVRGKTKIFNFF
ncbi:MAG: hypothetical protein H6849_04530 [Alphaproteobacteria bacterium]|nr:MAG: hypothetical protein H6849_04530 [Alphaproteobacteria bacterium]